MSIKMVKVAALILFVAVLRLACCEVKFHKRQDECELVSEGFNDVIGDCRSSIPACLEVARPSELDQFLCGSNGRSNYDTLVDCVGQTNADQTYGFICGGMTGPEGERCYDTIATQDGQAAFDACCNATNVNCSEECRTELLYLRGNVSCCLNTTPYILFFETCEVDQRTLMSFFDEGGLNFTDTCEHVFSRGGGARLTYSLATIMALSLLCLFAIVTTGI